MKQIKKTRSYSCILQKSERI